MKKLFYSLMTIAALLTAASCQKEFTNSADPAFGGKVVTTSFNVDLGIATKATTPATSTLDNGSKVDIVYAAAFDSNGNLLQNMPVTATMSNNGTSTTGTVKLNLVKNETYDIVFFAMKDGKYEVNFDDGRVANFSYKANATFKANDPEMDAFYKKIQVVASSESQGVELTRPFAQINILSSTKPEGVTSFNSTMTVNGVATSFDLFSGQAVTTGTTNLTFSKNAISADAFGSYATTHTWIGMNFILVPSTNGVGTVSLSFQEDNLKDDAGELKTLSIGNVSVAKNARTNLVGPIYTLDGSSFVVTVTPGFDSEGEGSVTDPDIETLITAPNTANPLVINCANGLNPVSVGLSVNVTEQNPNGDSFSYIGEHALDNGVIGVSVVSTGESEGKDIVTAEILTNENKVKITPLANGTATVTFTTPRYTKGTYAVGSFDIPVQVTGIKDPAVDPELTVTGFPTDPVTEPFTVTLSNNSDGELTITVAPEGAATVAAVSTATNTYTVTPAEQENNTEVTVTFATAATAAFNAGEAVGTFTIAGSGGGGQTGTDTVAKILEQITSTASATPSSYSANLAGAVVSYVNGSYVFIEDASAAILLFKANSGLTAGKTISGPVSGSGYIRNGAPQITEIGSECTIADGGTIPETTVTLANLLANYDGYISRRIKLEGVTVTDGIAASGDRNGEVSQNGSKIAVYSQLSSNGPVLNVNETGNFIAYPTVYNDKKQLSFFESSQFTKTGESTFLSATPLTTSVGATDTQVTWTISSNTAWTIEAGTGVTATPASGNGNGEVVLSFAANTAADSRTLTATAKATDCDDVTITITQNGTSVTTVTDVLDRDFTGVANGTTSYANWSDKTGTSGTVYAGNSAGSNNAIQLRSNNSNSGIITTSSVGKATKIVVTWNSNTDNARTLDIYGKTTAYSAATDLYGDNKGTKLGSIKKENQTELVIDGDYTYIGIRSNGGALYLDKIEITWQK